MYVVPNSHTDTQQYLKEFIECLLAYLQLLEEVADSLLQTSLLHQGEHTAVMIHFRKNSSAQRDMYSTSSTTKPSQQVTRIPLTSISTLTNQRLHINRHTVIISVDHLVQLWAALPATTGPPELLVNALEASLLLWQCPSPKDGLQIDPASLNLVEA